MKSFTLRCFRFAVVLLSCLLASCASLAQTAGKSSKKSPSRPSTRVFAPYLDVTQVPIDTQQVRNSGARLLTFAFVNAGKGCKPSWPGGQSVESDSTMGALATKYRASGGQIILAFGGYNGTELAQACSDPTSLQAAYESVLRKYKPFALDFDIENLALTDKASSDRRSAALKNLIGSHPALQIIFTLPATPSGLTADGLAVLTSAMAQQVPIGVVNLMVMNYGAAATSKNMGSNAIHAVEAAREQLRAMKLNAKLGITPMIGMNNSADEIFTIQDASVVLSFAERTRDVSLLSFWSVGRDNGTCRGKVEPKCSGVAQSDFQFTKIFSQFR